MTSPEPRVQVVDLVIALHGGESLTPAQRELADSATQAETDLVADALEAELLYLMSRPQIMPEDAALAAAVFGPPERSELLDGLPLDTFAQVVVAQKTAPIWDDADRARLAPIMAQWSPEARRLFQERFAFACPDGEAHWAD